MCTHQFTRPARLPSSSENASRNVTISVAMNSAMTTDSIETVAPSADGPSHDAPDEQEEDAERGPPPQTARARRRYIVKRGRAREVDDAEAAQELDERVAGKRDEAPEHERVRQAGSRPFTDRLALKDDVDEEALDAEGGMIEREAVRRRRQSGGRASPPAPRTRRRNSRTSTQNVSVAMTTVRAETAQAAQMQHGQRALVLCVLCGYSFSASIIAGTISNRSPTMP